MKTIIITTKNSNATEYYKIVENWFNSDCDFVEIESTIEIVQTSESNQSNYNHVLLRTDGDYRFFLPEFVDPNLAIQQRLEYVLDLFCIIAEKYEIQKENLCLFVHSGDLFSRGDARSGYGIVFNESLDCSPQMSERINLHIEDGHIFQFHHGINEVTNLLLFTSPKEGETISTLGEKLYKIFLKERTSVLGE